MKPKVDSSAAQKAACLVENLAELSAACLAVSWVGNLVVMMVVLMVASMVDNLADWWAGCWAGRSVECWAVLLEYHLAEHLADLMDLH